MGLSIALALSSLVLAAGDGAGSAQKAYLRGVAALKAEEPATAIRELSLCTQAVPERADCHWELGWAYYLSGQWSQVIAEWETVKKLKPDQPELEQRLTSARERFAQEQKRAMAAAAALEQKTAANTEPSAPTSAGESVRLRAVGDIMLGTDTPEGFLPPEDGANLLASVAPLLQDADFTFANAEGPLCDSGESNKCPRPSKTCYAFRTPSRYGRYFQEAGIDVVSTANNHSGDYGEICRRETERTFDELGIKWSGPPGSVATLEVKGRKIALIAFHTSAACNYVNDHSTAQALVKSASATHDWVIVSFHGGAEGAKALHVPFGSEKFHSENRGDLRVFAKKVIDAGADLVLGHGPHVLRAMEFYKDRLIAYSLGNFATYGRFDLSGNLGVGAVLEVTLGGDGKFESGRILPTQQVGEGVPSPDPKGRAIALIRKLSNEDFPGTGATLTEEGEIHPPTSAP